MRVEITVSMDPFVNPALDGSLTGMELIRTVRVVNNGRTITDGHLRVVTVPFITELSNPVDVSIPEGGTVEVDLSDSIDINPLHLLDLPESYISKLKVVLYTGDDDVVAESDVYNVRLLTCDTWPGCADRNLLCAFVVPSQPSLRKDVEPLRRSLSRSSSEDVAVSIVRVLRAKRMSRYETPSNLFKRPYRFMMYEGMRPAGGCTSLDMALAFSAMVEAVGLDPVIGVFARGFMTGIRGSSGGGWDAVTPVDPDLIFSGCNPEDIVSESRRSDKGPLDTLVDVSASRGRIQPVPYRLMEHGTGMCTSSGHDAELPIRYRGWMSRLLDISLNNSLLSMGSKVARTGLSSQDQLDLLQESLIVGNEVRTRFAHTEDDLMGWIRGNRIPLDPSCRDIMDVIRRGMAENMRESGIAGGSLGLGVVSWRDVKGRRHEAPLVLVSVDLRKLNEHSYALRHPDMEDAMVNIVLLERLRSEKGMVMPPLKEYVSGGMVDMPRLIRQIVGVQGVEYHPTAVFGEFGLETNAMWNDLESNSAVILSHPLVRILSRGECLDTLGCLDPDFDMNDLHPVLPVDSSQIAAMNAAVSGRSFVIKGPPGTGKSQTICNIICEVMRRGKTVLFVSQKASALEVIDRRLSGMGLGDHIIGIYGKKAKRSSVVDRLKGTVDRYRGSDLTEDMMSQPVETDALDRYYETVFGDHDGNESFYALYNRYLASLSGPDLLSRPGSQAPRAFGEDIGELDSLISHLPSDRFLSVMPLSDLSEGMRRGEVKFNATAMRKAHASCDGLCELLRRCGLGGDTTLDEVDSLAVNLMRLSDSGLDPSDIRVFGERVRRVEGLHDVALGYSDRVQSLGSVDNLDGLSKTMRSLRDVLSEMEGVCPGGIADVSEDIDRMIDRMDAIVPGEPWDTLTSGSDPGAVRIADALRASGTVVQGFQALLHHGSVFLQRAYPWAEPNPFRVSRAIADLQEISMGWYPDISRSDLAEGIGSLREAIRDADSIITDIRRPLDGWQVVPDIGSHHLRFNRSVIGLKEDRVVSSLFDLDGFAKAFMSVIDTASGYNSILKRSDAFWYPSIYGVVDAEILSWEQLEDRRLVNRINGSRSIFMKRIESMSRCKVRYGEVRDRLEVARRVRRDRDVVYDCIRGYERAREALMATVREREARGREMESIRERIPGWRDILEHGHLDDRGDIMELDRLCASASSMLEEVGIVSEDLPSVDFRRLSVLCDRIVSDMDMSREYDAIHDGCMSVVREVPEITEGKVRHMHDMESLLALVHPDNTGIPMGCTLMLMQDSEGIHSQVSSCRTLLEPYDSIVCTGFGSGMSNISDISDRAALLASLSKDLKAFQLFASMLRTGGDRFAESVLDVLGTCPREDVVASLERSFLGNILDVRVGKAFGIDNYGRGMLPDYEEQVREAYDAMYECNRSNLLGAMRNRAIGMASDPSLDTILSKDIPLSQVLDSVSDVLQSIIPCFIMNVQSVSRFLGNTSMTFDYVVFDESSQIPVADSISSLSKGRTCIIVGDTNQLPPTTFFRNNIGDQSEGETESILEECIFKGMPSLELEWHYRSNHESLIAYSNSRFYDNRLITFPSVSDRVSRVDLRYVEGAVYMRGEGRNPIEAEAVVDEIYRICSDPSYSGESIGVVTFGTSQKEAVEDALAERQGHRQLWYSNRRESLSIGNLESIQGEERDIVLISVGYGHDINGRLSLNFGPLNQGRGWRRLNVAISRARDRMTVFSSIHPSEIRVDADTGRGLRELRGFLEYAESGCFERRITSADIIDPILPDVAGVVEQMGYETSLNIGKSELRIDVAVVDPVDPDRYCLAILLDRNLHDNSRNPVDRDYTKVRFLRKMGWKVLRVHTIDWMMDRDATVKRIRGSLPSMSVVKHT